LVPVRVRALRVFGADALGFRVLGLERPRRYGDVSVKRCIAGESYGAPDIFYHNAPIALL
jgi:hypothetical protein